MTYVTFICCGQIYLLQIYYGIGLNTHVLSKEDIFNISTTLNSYIAITYTLPGTFLPLNMLSNNIYNVFILYFQHDLWIYNISCYKRTFLHEKPSC